MPAPDASLRFAPSDAFTLGVEEELLIVAQSSLRLWPKADAVLAAVQPAIGSLAGEVSDGVLELITPLCGTVGEAVAVLEGLRLDVGRAVRLIGAGVHPLGRFGNVRLRPGARYELIGSTMRAVMRQTPHCGCMSTSACQTAPV